MSGPRFFQTIMGRTFYEGTVPRLVRALEGINEKMELVVKLATNPLVTVQGEPKLYDEDGKKLSPEEKAIMFGHVYGMGAKEIQEELVKLEDELSRMKKARNELEDQKREHERLDSWPLRVDMECTNCKQGVELVKVEVDPPTYRCPNCDIEHEFDGWFDEYGDVDEAKAEQELEKDLDEMGGGPHHEAPLPWEVQTGRSLYEAQVLSSPQRPGSKVRTIVSSGSRQTCEFIAGLANRWNVSKAEGLLHEISDALTAAVDEKDARAMAEKLKQILWPNGDKDFEWDSDILDEVGNTLREYGYGPEKP